MRFLFVIDGFGGGGAQRQMVNLAIGLSNRDYEVEFWRYYPQHDHFALELQKAGLPIHGRPKKNRFSLGPLRDLRHRIVKGGYDAVLAFLSTPNLYAEIASIGIRGIPLIVSERSAHGSSSFSVKPWILQQLHHLADHITVNSHHRRESLEGLFPWMRGKVTTIYNGVNLNMFKPMPIPKYHGPHIELLAVGSVRPVKNAIGLIRALARYRQLHGGTCTVRWAGKVSVDSASQQDFKAASELLSQTGLQDQWEWLGERKDISDLMVAHDGLIHLSFHEGLPNVVCEALACGRPVLASDVCDHHRLVQNGVTGFLFDPHSTNSIVHAIHKFNLLSVSERISMGQAARHFAETELSQEICTDRYEALFLQLTASKSCGVKK